MHMHADRCKDPKQKKELLQNIGRVKSQAKDAREQLKFLLDDYCTRIRTKNNVFDIFMDTKVGG